MTTRLDFLAHPLPPPVPWGAILLIVSGLVCALGLSVYARTKQVLPARQEAEAKPLPFSTAPAAPLLNIIFKRPGLTMETAMPSDILAISRWPAVTVTTNGFWVTTWEAPSKPVEAPKRKAGRL